MQKTQCAGGVVLNARAEVLVVNQGGLCWSLPKGHIDAGEDALAAAKREIYEESGVSHLALVRELGVYQRFRTGMNGIGEDKNEFKTITLFLFTTNQEALSPIDPLNPEARWVNKENVAALLTHPKDKEFFLSIISALSSSH